MLAFVGDGDTCGGCVCMGIDGGLGMFEDIGGDDFLGMGGRGIWTVLK